jgi:hypothetical protein
MAEPPRPMQVIVFQGDGHHHNWPRKAVDFIPWLQKHIDSVPQEHRANVDLHIAATQDESGAGWSEVEISYWVTPS